MIWRNGDMGKVFKVQYRKTWALVRAEKIPNSIPSYPTGWPCSSWSDPVGSIFVLSLCLTPGHQYFLEKSLCTCLVLWFLQLLPRRRPLITCLWWPVRLTFRFHRTVKNKQRVLNWWTPLECKDCTLKHTPSLSVKEAYLFVLKLWLEGQASDLTYI